MDDNDSIEVGVTHSSLADILSSSSSYIPSTTTATMNIINRRLVSSNCGDDGVSKISTKRTESNILTKPDWRPFDRCDNYVESKPKTKQKPKLSWWRWPFASADESSTVASYAISGSFLEGELFPVLLPHTTLVEIMGFCDSPTLLAFRGVSRVFRDVEIPQEFHHRAMARLRSVSLDDNSSHRQATQRASPSATSPTRQEKASQDRPSKRMVPRNVRYSYGKKVVNEEHRKVWIFLRDNTVGVVADDTQRRHSERHAARTSSCYNTNVTKDNNFVEASSHDWSMHIVTTKVLKLIRDMEFYKGDVFGYDEARARSLLLRKGCIHDGDFPVPPGDGDCPRKFFSCPPKHKQTIFPAYGKWRVEASVRKLSLKEALEILSGNDNRKKKTSIQMQRDVQTARRRQRPGFRKTTRNEIHEQLHCKLTQGLEKKNKSGNTTAISLLVAASGSSSNNNSNTTGEPSLCKTGIGATACTSIHLAEYSTVFEQTRMSCSILLIQTIGDAEAELRVLSGEVVEPTPKSTAAAVQWLGWWRSFARRSGRRTSAIATDHLDVV